MKNTPSALTWLVNTRARVAFDLARVEVIAVEVSQRLEKMRLDLVSIDRTIKVFDSRLDPLKIEPIHAHRRPGTRGSMRAAMLQILKDGAPEWLGTDVIEAFVTAQLALTFETPAARKRWYVNVFRKQLKRFVEEGLADRLEPSDERPVEMGRWRLKVSEPPTLAALREGTAASAA